MWDFIIKLLIIIFENFLLFIDFDLIFYYLLYYEGVWIYIEGEFLFKFDSNGYVIGIDNGGILINDMRVMFRVV